MRRFDGLFRAIMIESVVVKGTQFRLPTLDSVELLRQKINKLADSRADAEPEIPAPDSSKSKRSVANSHVACEQKLAQAERRHAVEKEAINQNVRLSEEGNRGKIEGKDSSPHGQQLAAQPSNRSQKSANCSAGRTAHRKRHSKQSNYGPNNRNQQLLQ